MNYLESYLNTLTFSELAAQLGLDNEIALFAYKTKDNLIQTMVQTDKDHKKYSK